MSAHAPSPHSAHRPIPRAGAGVTAGVAPQQHAQQAQQRQLESAPAVPLSVQDLVAAASDRRQAPVSAAQNQCRPAVQTSQPSAAHQAASQTQPIRRQPDNFKNCGAAAERARAFYGCTGLLLWPMLARLGVLDVKAGVHNMGP